MASRPELVILNGEMKGRRFAVNGVALRLGRSSSNDIHVPDDELSRNHCLFEPSGESGIRVTDLASANGTRVNGNLISIDPVELQEGDFIEVGRTVLSVGEPVKPAAQTSIDLGLGTKVEELPTGQYPEQKTKKRKSLFSLLWAVAIVLPVIAIATILLSPVEEREIQLPSVAEEPEVREVSYEKVKADSTGIFRYALTAKADGQITVKIDDTTNNRHLPPKTKNLTDEGLEELSQILSYRSILALENLYSGPEPDPPALESHTLKVVYSTRVKTVEIRNTPVPDAFAAIRDKLEAFSKSELGVWAIAYSREKLIELAEDKVRLGTLKWEDRDVKYENLAMAIEAFEEARFYLETVNPKPACFAQAADGLAKAKAELDRRYTDQRFLADRALNLSQWETARDELKILLEMVPDRRDDRNRDARQKLVSAENNLKKKGGK